LTPQAASIVIVSRGRPALLRRCLVGLDQQDHPEFEIIVVADADGVAEVAHMGWADRVKVIRFDEANISAARNEGISAAAAPVVAFIDDDAVAEHDWLRRLTAPITEKRADAAGGFVLGRNGLSFQWAAREVFADATVREISVDRDEETILTSSAGRGIKTEGTNMAFRRSLLIELSGFDVGYAYYLDETDVILRRGRVGEGLGFLAGEVGLDLEPFGEAPDPEEARLRSIYDDEIEAAARAAYQRDYVGFGFGDWDGQAA
jgi:cellulose synthase/poly-beta-1,6-N-acetylglucosamine synthase-like glycosyltransferase